jgi:hypothetical protein
LPGTAVECSVNNNERRASERLQLKGNFFKESGVRCFGTYVSHRFLRPALLLSANSTCLSIEHVSVITEKRLIMSILFKTADITIDSLHFINCLHISFCNVL